MRRRAFIAALGGAAAWPVVARGQPAGMPVVGFLSTISPGAATQLVAAFHEGLKEQGYVEGRNIWIHYRWAEGRYDELESLAADLSSTQGFGDRCHGWRPIGARGKKSHRGYSYSVYERF